MRVLRRATRRWMIAVAVVALACATTILIMEERERFARIARQHPGVFPPLASADIAEGLRVVRSCRRFSRLEGFEGFAGSEGIAWSDPVNGIRGSAIISDFAGRVALAR